MSTATKSMEGRQMRIRIQQDVCQGHGVCFMSAPEVFALRDEDGQAYLTARIVDGVVPSDLADSAALGADSCPERAIVVE